MLDIKVKYLSDEVPRLKFVGGYGHSAWVDLCAAEDIKMGAGSFKLIPLGIAMELPEGYEAHIVPRSSTYKKFGIIQTNHCGIVDPTYCGDGDQWYMPAYALRNTEIKAGERICQFRVVECQPELNFETVDTLGNEDRGGIGSTGS